MPLVDLANAQAPTKAANYVVVIGLDVPSLHCRWDVGVMDGGVFKRIGGDSYDFSEDDAATILNATGQLHATKSNQEFIRDFITNKLQAAGTL